MRVVIDTKYVVEESFVNADGETINFKKFGVQIDNEAPVFMTLNGVKKRMSSGGELVGVDKL